MSLTDYEQSIFDLLPSECPATSTETEKQSNSILFYCNICNESKNSSYIYNQYSDTSIPYLLFNCIVCSNMWTFCTLCPYINQPKHISKRDQKRHRNSIYQLFKKHIDKHTSIYHPNHLAMLNINTSNTSLTSSHLSNSDIITPIQCNIQQQSLNYELTNSIHSDDDNYISNIDSDSQTKSSPLSTLKEDLLKVFPDVDDELTKKYNSHIREVLYDKNVHHSYSQYLIKKTWLKTSKPNLVIKKSDCDLFLRIIRQLIMHSRQERGKIVDIYQRIEARSDSHITALNNQIDELKNIVSSQKNEISLIHQKYSSAASSSTSEVHTAILNNSLSTDSNYISKLKLPHTLKDTRQLIESPNSFVNGLLTPTIQINPSDGYAYILPSNVLPISIASGITFEKITANTDLTKLHSRSKYKSPDVLSILKTLMINNPNDNTTNLCIDLEDRNDTYYVGLGLWSDGCDAGGASKANRSLVKLITIHVIHPKLEEQHVFPVGFGNNKGDHEYVRKKILNDLHELSLTRKLCYVPSLKKIVFIKFFLAYIIQDRVEHCDFTGFTGHAGIYSRVPGISSPYVIYSERSNHCHGIAVQKSLASCSQCFKYRMQEHMKKKYSISSTSNINCPMCTDWDLLSIRYQPHPDFQKMHLPSKIIQ